MFACINFASFAIQNTLGEDSDQSARMRRAHMPEGMFADVADQLFEPQELGPQIKEYTVDSRYLEFQETLKQFEISVSRHIRFLELKKKIIRTTTFNKFIRNCSRGSFYVTLPKFCPKYISTHLWLAESSSSHFGQAHFQFKGRLICLLVYHLLWKFIHWMQTL